MAFPHHNRKVLNYCTCSWTRFGDSIPFDSLPGEVNTAPFASAVIWHRETEGLNHVLELSKLEVNEKLLHKRTMTGISLAK